MEDTGTKDNFPFSENKGKQIARGWSESKVYEHGEGWVIKETYRGKRNSEEQLKENKADYEFFKSRLGEFVPETQFVRGQDEIGRKVNFVRQKRIIGKSLLEFSDREIEGNGEIRKNLADLFGKLIKMWEEDGRIPDLVGPKTTDNILGKISKFTPGTHPEHTANIIVEEGTDKVYLIDTSASTRFQSKKSPWPYRKLSEAIVSNMRKFVKKIQ